MATAAPTPKRQPIKTLSVAARMLRNNPIHLSEPQLAYKRRVDDALDSVAKAIKPSEVLTALANVGEVIEEQHDPALADAGRTIAISLMLLEAKLASDQGRPDAVARMVPKARLALETSVNLQAPVRPEPQPNH